MGRPKGFKMSDEQKAAMAAGRKAARVERIASGEIPPIKEKSEKKTNRTLTPEHLAKITEGRRLARERKIASGEPVYVRRTKKNKKGKVEVNKENKPILTVSGKEKDAFDFYTLIRDAFRSLERYGEINKILQEITDKVYWQNINWIHTTLSKYVELHSPD